MWPSEWYSLRITHRLTTIHFPNYNNGFPTSMSKFLAKFDAHLLYATRLWLAVHAAAHTSRLKISQSLSLIRVPQRRFPKRLILASDFQQSFCEKYSLSKIFCMRFFCVGLKATQKMRIPNPSWLIFISRRHNMRTAISGLWTGQNFRVTEVMYYYELILGLHFRYFLFGPIKQIFRIRWKKSLINSCTL